jgi:hypothetical protein
MLPERLTATVEKSTPELISGTEVESVVGALLIPNLISFTTEVPKTCCAAATK